MKKSENIGNIRFSCVCVCVYIYIYIYKWPIGEKQKSSLAVFSVE